MKPIISILPFLLLYTLTICQEFSTKIYFEDAIGNLDSMTVGYDLNATYNIDSTFGEVNIYGTPRDSIFDVRGSNEWQDGIFPPPIYHSKTEIGPLDCDDIRLAFNLKIDILARYWPIRIFWNHREFQTECIENSLINDSNINGLSDVGGGGNYQYQCLGKPDEFIFPRHNDYDKYHIFIDTLTNDTIYYIFLNIGFIDNLGFCRSVSTLTSNRSKLNIFPNPCVDLINVTSITPDYPLKYKIVNINGKVFKQGNLSDPFQLNISNIPSGIYFLISTDNALSTKYYKFLKI